MSRGRLASLSTRLKNSLVALLFVGTQIAFPLTLTGSAAAAGFSLEQCQNGSLASPATCSGSDWVTGNANTNKSHWREGDSIPYRATVTGLSAGSHTLTINWDTTAGGKHALDYITSFNRTQTAADPCSDVTGCSTSPAPSTYTIPADPNVTAQGVTPVAGNFTLYDGTLTGVSGYTLSGSYSSNSTTSVTVSYTTTGSNTTVVLAWGGHIASQIDWGYGNSASAINGSSYHTSLGGSSDGTTGSKDVQLMASAVFPTPTITTQVSTATVAVDGNVSDTATLTGVSGNTPLKGTVAFFVCGPNTTSNPSCASGGTQVGSAVAVSPGTGYAGTATSAAYQPAAVGNYCFRAEFTPSSDSPYSPQNHTNTTTECFTASIPPSTITIIKDAQPDSTQSFSFTTTGGLSTDQSGFTLSDPGTGTTNTQTFSSVAPGTYTVTEQATSGWDFKSINCGAANNVSISGTQVTITIGSSGNQSVSCTYTNAQQGTLTVNKVTVPANDPTGFSVTASGTSTVSNATQTVTTSTPVVYTVSQGTYSVSEQVPDGWSQTGNTCTGIVVSANNLNPSCTITNTKLAKLKIVKATAPASSSQAFSFGATGPSITQGNGSFMLDTNANDNTYPDNYPYTNLTPGSYSVTETEPSGWQLTGLTCSGIDYTWPGNTQALSLNLAAGADVTCTFTNTQLATISGTKYEANADSSHVGTLQGWTIYLLVNGQTINHTTTDANGNFSFSGLLPGAYSLAEQLLDGWTQIFAPGALNLSAGQTATGNDFGNFHNASISGAKFNDANGDHAWEVGEPGLPGWTITLYDNGSSGALLNHQVAQTTTAADGSYSFTNLPPTTYKVCETQQSGWIATYPDSTGCQTVTVALSGRNYSGTNFGNQGRGTLTVVKNVDDGFGNISKDVTSWTWGYDGTYGSASAIATGSTNKQSAAAGSYTVSENQKPDYHVTSSSCSGENDTTVSISKSVTVSPGEDVVCTFTNTRDTATVTVNKTIVPNSDSGLFDLNINGPTSYTAFNQSNGGSTGAQTVLTGSYTVSETAGTSTDLSDYSSTYDCDNGLSGNGSITPSFSVAQGDEVSCTFTNTKLATLTVIKDANPDSSQAFGFHFGSQVNGANIANAANLVADTPFSLVDDGSNSGVNQKQFAQLTPGNYYVSEDSVADWDLTGIACPGLTFTRSGSQIAFTLAAGDTVTCTYSNTERGSIHGTKAIVNSDGSTAASQAGISGVTIKLYQGSTATGTPFATTTTDSHGNYDFASLIPGDYTVAEVTPDGYTAISGGGMITVAPGQDVTGNGTVDFGNFQNGSISGYKFNDQNGNGQWDNNEPKLSGWTINLYTGGSADPANLYASKVTDGSGNYSFTSLPPNDYYVCEVGQSGWTQTSSPTCYTIAINQSGEADTAVFGNQGRGSITVIKNVENYADGQWTTTTDASGWTWDLTGTYYSNADNAAGSTNTLSNLPADTYTIHEDQQTNYHFTSVACTDNSQPITVTQAESTSVVLNAGSNIVCTYTNTRDTGTVTVNKTIVPDSDSGLFNLNITGPTSFTATNKGNGGSTGAQTVVTGSYTVSETAGNNTDMKDYSSAYSCTNGLSGSGTSTPSFTVGNGAEVSCTFTNTRLATLTIVKNVESVNEADYNTSFSFTGTDPIGDFSLTDNGSSDNTKTFYDLPLGSYQVAESQTGGWTLGELYCSDDSQQLVLSYTAYINLDAGSNLTCTFVNYKLATVSVTKYKDLNRNGTYDSTAQTSGLGVAEPTLSGWKMTLANMNTESSATQPTQDPDGSTSFNDVVPGFYSLDETPQDGWNFSNTYCDNTEGGLDGPYYFEVAPGADIHCYVGNYQNPVLNITKSNNKPNPTVVGDTVTYTIVVTVPEDSGAVFGATVTDLPPDNFTYVPGSWTASSNMPSHDVAGDVGEGPNYGSPGSWNLGNLLPGEKITLTYQAKIGSNVSDGTYPDLAFTAGCSTPLAGGQCLSNTVVGNLNAVTPFVGTQVTIVSVLPTVTYTAGEVLGTSVLVNTGTTILSWQYILPVVLILGVYLTRRLSEEKGGK